MTAYNLLDLDTTPGATGERAALAPPATVTTAEQYLDWLRSISGTQQFSIVIRYFAGKSLSGLRPRIHGPFADTLEFALERAAEWQYRNTGWKPRRASTPSSQDSLPLFQ